MGPREQEERNSEIYRYSKAGTTAAAKVCSLQPTTVETEGSRFGAEQQNKFRLQQKVIGAVDRVVDTICTKAARRKGARSPETIQTPAFDAVLSHPQCREAMQQRCETFAAKSELSSIQGSIADVWHRLSKASVVATTEGFALRRAVAAAMAGPGVSFKAAKKFLKGFLKRRAFKDTSERHATFMGGNGRRTL